MTAQLPLEVLHAARVIDEFTRRQHLGLPSVEAMLRVRPHYLTDGQLRLDLHARRAHRATTELTLTAREFDLLAFLMSHPNEAFTRQQLLERVWGWRIGDQTTVTVHVRRLREKLEDNPAVPTRITTVRGVGYRYDPAEPRQLTA